MEELPPSQKLLFYFKDGVDGSGSHLIYNQEDNKHTHNMIVYMFTPLKWTTDDGDIIWFEQSPCSPHAARPLMIFLGKGDLENMKVVMRIQKEGQEIEVLIILIEEKIY